MQVKDSYSEKEQRMCLGTFSRLRRSLATSTLSAAVRILAERFLLYRKAISCKVKNTAMEVPVAVFFIPLTGTDSVHNY